MVMPCTLSWAVLGREPVLEQDHEGQGNDAGDRDEPGTGAVTGEAILMSL